MRLGNMFSFRFLIPAVTVAVTITPSLGQVQGQATSTTPPVIGVPTAISTFGWGNYWLTAGHNPTIGSTITLEQIYGSAPSPSSGDLFNFTSSGMLSVVSSVGNTTSLCLGPMWNSATGYNPNVGPFDPHPNPGPNRIILYACDDKDDNQQWVLKNNTFQHAVTGWCLDAVWLPTILTPCQSTMYQRWSQIPTPDPTTPFPTALPTQPASSPSPSPNPSSTGHDAWLVSTLSSSSSSSSTWLVPVLASFLGVSLVLLGVVSVMLYRYMKLAQQTKHIKSEGNVYIQQP